mmetsp:Transcript_19332/g.34235  ORF Transcript_19332/g.34235 Transcript_19332/m.34235 type:complete len:408 (+) Transcript_19332:2929-4152(+)
MSLFSYSGYAALAAIQTGFVIADSSLGRYDRMLGEFKLSSRVNSYMILLTSGPQSSLSSKRRASATSRNFCISSSSGAVPATYIFVNSSVASFSLKSSGDKGAGPLSSATTSSSNSIIFSHHVSSSKLGTSAPALSALNISNSASFTASLCSSDSSTSPSFPSGSSSSSLSNAQLSSSPSSSSDSASSSTSFSSSSSHPSQSASSSSSSSSSTSSCSLRSLTQSSSSEKSPACSSSLSSSSRPESKASAPSGAPWRVASSSTRPWRNRCWPSSVMYGHMLRTASRKARPSWSSGVVRWPSGRSNSRRTISFWDTNASKISGRDGTRLGMEAFAFGLPSSSSGGLVVEDIIICRGTVVPLRDRTCFTMGRTRNTNRATANSVMARRPRSDWAGGKLEFTRLASVSQVL